MHKGAQRSSVNDQLGYESPKVRWREGIDLEKFLPDGSR